MVIIYDGRKEGGCDGHRKLDMAWEAAHWCWDLVQASLGSLEASGTKLDEDVGRSPKEYFSWKLFQGLRISPDGDMKGYKNHHHFRVTQRSYRRAGSYEKLPAKRFISTIFVDSRGAYLQGSNGDTDIESSLMDWRGWGVGAERKERVRCMEKVTWKYIHYHV